MHNYEIMHGDVESFIKCFYEEKKRGVGSIVNNISKGKVYLYRADLDDTFALMMHVVDDFCKEYIGFEGHLCIYVDENNEKYMNELFAILGRYESCDVSIQIIMFSEISFDELIRECDFYISGRNKNTISDLTMVALNGKKHIAGCAYPVFK